MAAPRCARATARFPATAQDAGSLPNAIIDTEIVALDPDGRPDFPALLRALSARRSGALVLYAFDMLFYCKSDIRGYPLLKRKQLLASAIGMRNDVGHIRFAPHLVTNGSAVFEAAFKMGLKGIVSKQFDAPYRPGRTTARR